MLNVGLSTCGKIIDENLFKNLQSNNITHIEISCSSAEYENLNYKDIYRFAENYQIELWSYHLPFSPFTIIDISEKSTSESTVLYYSELIKQASDIGIRNFIVHPSGEPINEIKREIRINTAKESLYKLAEIAKDNGSTILVENLPRTCLGRNSDEINDLISVHSNLGVCFDTNHLLEESIESFIKNLGNKIFSTHISDYDMLNERHWLPGEGCIDWQSLYNCLLSVGYNGPWLYEVGFLCPQTIIRSRNLNCEDFRKNADEIFANNIITVFSKPVYGLSSWK